MPSGFADLLKPMLAIPGVRGVSLIEADGIPIESFESDGTAALETLSAEIAAFLHALQGEETERAVPPQRIALKSDQGCALWLRVGRDYYLVLLLERDAPSGRAAYELHKVALRVESELS